MEILPSIKELVKALFSRLENKPLPLLKDEPVPLDLPGPFQFYEYKGEIIGEAVYKQIMEPILEERYAKERKKKKEENVAAVKRRFANHDEILAVIDTLTEEHQYVVLEFLVNLRKKHRDELDWERFKDDLLHKGTVTKEMKNRIVNKTEDTNGIDRKHKFDTFVVGNSNRFAAAAAIAVTAKPGENYNPLFIYGDTGLGKTHLLHAIGNAILEASPNAKVKYVNSEAFTNGIIKAIIKQKAGDFQEEYLSLDCLMVDDIQFFEGKERTQEELFYIINTLKEKNKQIVIAGSCHPQKMGKLAERLRTRLVNGLTVDIQPPDLETRIAILRKKAEMEKIDMPDDVIDAVAGSIENNISLLEGVFNQITAYAKMMNTPVTIEIAEKAVKTFRFYDVDPRNDKKNK